MYIYIYIYTYMYIYIYISYNARMQVYVCVGIHGESSSMPVLAKNAPWLYCKWRYKDPSRDTRLLYCVTRQVSKNSLVVGILVPDLSYSFVDQIFRAYLKLILAIILAFLFRCAYLYVYVHRYVCVYIYVRTYKHAYMHRCVYTNLSDYQNEKNPVAVGAAGLEPKSQGRKISRNSCNMAQNSQPSLPIARLVAILE